MAQARRTVAAWTVAGIISIAVVAGLAGAKFIQISQAMAMAAAFPEPAEAVELYTVNLIESARTTRAIGELEAIQRVDLRVEIAGVVSEVGFSSGEIVEDGQILLRLDTAEERAQLAAARIEARRTQAEAARERALFGRGASAEASLDIAEAQAAAAQARVTAIETAINRKTIRAPFAGRVGITDLRPGQFVAAGDLATRLVGLDEALFVDFALPQHLATAFDRSRPVTIVKGAVRAQALIVAVDPAIDPATRSLSFRAEMAEPAANMTPGGLVSVIVETEAPRSRIVAPRTAIVRSPYGDSVFVIAEADGQLRARSQLVEVGASVGDQLVAIEAGLTPGTLIAADGSFKLRDGALVAPAPESASSATANLENTP